MNLQIAPITRLPNEMLGAIFDIHVAWVYQKGHKDVVLLLAYTQVCRWWRYVALSSPRLWRYINVCQPKLAILSLTRSQKSIPLSVVSSPGERLPFDWMPLHSHAARICEIDIDLWHFDLRRALFGIGYNYPNLNSLRLISRRQEDQDQDIELYCDLPSLRRLSLDGVCLRWSSLTDLTHLSLYGLCVAHAPSMLEIHSILRNSPRLESLTLAFLAHTPSMEHYDRRQIIELPRLSEIHLCLCPVFTSSLLAGLSIPPSAQLRVGSFSAHDGFLSVFPKAGGTPHPHLRITKHSTLSIRLREIFLHQSNTNPFADACSKPELVIDMPHPTPAYAWMLSDVPRLFDLFALVTLELDIIWAVDVENLAAALHALLTATPNIRTLRASQHGAECLSMVLGRPGSDRLEFDVICPSLTRLSFGAPDQMWWDFPLRWLEPLLACLEERAACTGTRLQTIEFLGQGRIEKKSAQALAPFVEKIVDSVSTGRSRW
jgi:hypothetical protein